MPVVDNNKVPHFAIPGINHQTVADARQGLKTMEVWKQTIVAGGSTPVHRHACEEVIVILKGSGKVTIEGVETRFGPNSTLVLPHDAVHQIINTGADDMELIAALGMAPVRVRTGDGAELPLPWQVQ
ncbi:MAG TPA: cupin domain-containing protein [Candidatus Binataceae bacterium]|nr:cupin domain-containing protein [Candidatus Binataceae bacterium]